MPKISWIQPLFHYADKFTVVGVSEKHQEQLKKMAEELIQSEDLMATYVPEGTDEGYNVGKMHGRVTSLIKLLDMPKDRTTENYGQLDTLTGKLRWPHGWPCEVVCTPPVEECCKLRTIIDDLYGSGSFGAWAHKFKSTGPVKLNKAESKALEAYFAPFYPF